MGNYNIMLFTYFIFHKLCCSIKTIIMNSDSFIVRFHPFDKSERIFYNERFLAC